ncbi:MAG: hypothetical protein MPN21_10965 [Thermoanaerobaculia bacterium]|nr:hypothetical protein [Thermoanaerobaculia bacterium]
MTLRRAFLCLVVLSLAVLLTGPVAAQETESAPPVPLQSLSSLAFGPDGVLFIGDAKAGAVFAIETGDVTEGVVGERFGLRDLETQLAAMLGTRASEVLIHDLAVNPSSRNMYLAVSRGRAGWDSRWELPNDLADASILVRITTTGELEEVSLEGLAWSKAVLPDPVDAAKTHRWKRGVSLRTDTITDLAYDEGTVWVAGLSNEEFASTLWRVAYPFENEGESRKTTVEIFHGAHGEWETHAPIRAFVPYELEGKRQLLAAYLCTPLVTFDTANLQDGAHVKGRTVAEFGSGNYPLDMVVYQKDGAERLLIANSNLPMMIVDPADIASFEGEINTEVEGYVAGVPYEIRSGTGVQQLDVLDENRIVVLQRLPGGTLDLVTLSTRRF